MQGSSTHWNEGVNDYLPFVRYLLGVITASYNEFYTQVDILVKKGLSSLTGCVRSLKIHQERLQKLRL